MQNVYEKNEPCNFWSFSPSVSDDSLETEKSTLWERQIYFWVSKERKKKGERTDKHVSANYFILSRPLPLSFGLDSEDSPTVAISVRCFYIQKRITIEQTQRKCLKLDVRKSWGDRVSERPGPGARNREIETTHATIQTRNLFTSFLLRISLPLAGFLSFFKSVLNSTLKGPLRIRFAIYKGLSCSSTWKHKAAVSILSRGNKTYEQCIFSFLIPERTMATFSAL